MATTGSSPCGACKFLRRKCASDCVFAPYFCSDQGSARFAAIHKVFGASNVSKLLMRVPVEERCETVVTIAYEAQARLQDPVYGCVRHVFALQQQVAYLQGQIMQFKAQMAAQGLVESRNCNIIENNDQQHMIYEWQYLGDDIHMGPAGGSNNIQSNINNFETNYCNNNNYMINSNFSSGHDQSAMSTTTDSMESLDGMYGMQEIESNMSSDSSSCNYERKFSFQSCSNMGELQALAITMMRN